jgi:hypothetical protein
MSDTTLDQAIEKRIADCKRDAAEEMYLMLESFLCLEGLIKTDKIQALLTKARGEI